MYYRKRKNGKYLFEIKRKGFPRIAKTRGALKLGKKWAIKVEHQIDKSSLILLKLEYLVML